MFFSKPEIISKNLKTLEDTSKAKLEIGKTVYSKSGEYVGKVYDLIFKEHVILGFMISGKKDMFIGREYIANESKESVVLNIEPVINLIGKQVFDATGKRIGTVSRIGRKSNANTYNEIFVKKAFYRFAFPISKDKISVAKKNIILKNSYESK